MDFPFLGSNKKSKVAGENVGRSANQKQTIFILSNTRLAVFVTSICDVSHEIKGLRAIYGQCSCQSACNCNEVYQGIQGLLNNQPSIILAPSDDLVAHEKYRQCSSRSPKLNCTV